MAREKGFAVLSLIVLMVILSAVGAGVYLVQHPQILKSRADFLKCSSIYVQVSADKQTWSDSIQVSGKATKYYLMAKNASDKTTPCSTNFDATQGPGYTNVISPWGQFKSGSDGIARIDIVGIKPGTYIAKFRPSKGDEWSNTITVAIGQSSASKNIFSLLTDRSKSESSSYNLADYFIFNPGYTWLYVSKNNQTGKTGTTRLQIEQETNWCNVITRPWRFTKSIQDAYWAPGSDRNLRWMLVSPNFQNKELPDYDNYIWAYGDKAYQILDSNSLKDINPDAKALISGHVYTSTNPKFPAYNLAPKSMGSSYAVNQDGSSRYTTFNYAATETCQSSLTPAGLAADGSWRVRIDQDKVDINNPHFKYSGDALRIDYYEGLSFTGKNLLRESWYFVKKIGLVKILEKKFNNYAGGNFPFCLEDSDCLNDTISSPGTEVTLDQYFQNPTLTDITVGSYNGSSCSNFSTSVTVSKQKGYCLKTGDIPLRLSSSQRNFRLWSAKL